LKIGKGEDMKKLMINLFIMVFVLSVSAIVLMSEPRASESLQIENTDIDGSNDLVKDVYIKANMGKKELVDSNTTLYKENKVTINYIHTEYGMNISVYDKDGKKILEDEVKGNKDLVFQATPGDGIIRMKLNKGPHEIMVEFNEVGE